MDIENKKLATNDMLVKYFNDGVTKVLSEYFDVKCCEKGHSWFTSWEGASAKGVRFICGKRISVSNSLGL